VKYRDPTDTNLLHRSVASDPMPGRHRRQGIRGDKHLIYDMDGSQIAESRKYPGNLIGMEPCARA
jgi:hypothetical protein